ncbi:hypothetical protein HanPSC8_Chr06g0232621 [Helianthus annuus]|nr:hypothetical protein HanPSC8_Chr06g0232621 [Helianthus annuus]
MNAFPLISLIIKTIYSEIPISQTQELSQEAVELFSSFVVQSPLIRNEVSFLGFMGV